MIDDKVVTSKKRLSEKGVEEVVESTKIVVSSEFDAVSNMDFSNPLSKESKKKPRSSPGVPGMATLFAMIERFDKV